MGKFVFRPQPVLELRQHEEDRKKKVVGELQTEINRLQQEALQLADEIKNYGQDLKAQYQQGEINLDWVAHYRSFVMHARMSINQRIEQVQQVQKKLVLARQDLAQAAKRRKSLELLKEKRWERYRRERERQETRAQDELGTNLYLRRSRPA